MDNSGRFGLPSSVRLPPETKGEDYNIFGLDQNTDILNKFKDLCSSVDSKLVSRQ